MENENKKPVLTQPNWEKVNISKNMEEQTISVYNIKLSIRPTWSWRVQAARSGLRSKIYSLIFLKISSLFLNTHRAMRHRHQCICRFTLSSSNKRGLGFESSCFSAVEIKIKNKKFTNFTQLKDWGHWSRRVIIWEVGWVYIYFLIHVFDF